MKNAKQAFALLRKDLLVIESAGLAYVALAEDEAFSVKITNVEAAIYRLVNKNGQDAVGALPFKRILTVRSIVAMVMLGYPIEAIDWLKKLGTNYQVSATNDEIIFSDGCAVGMIFGLSQLAEANESINQFWHGGGGGTGSHSASGNWKGKRSERTSQRPKFSGTFPEIHHFCELRKRW